MTSDVGSQMKVKISGNFIRSKNRFPNLASSVEDTVIFLVIWMEMNGKTNAEFFVYYMP